MPKRGRTSSACWTSIARIAVASALCVALAESYLSPARAADPLATVLMRYERAMSDPGAVPLTRYEATGSLSGVGLNGLFHEWVTDDRHRSDANLGPRTQRTLQIGEHFYYLDENGFARELTGVLLRRARTQTLIDSGGFAQLPERCVLRLPGKIGGMQANAIDVTAVGGDTETLYLAESSGLPLRVRFDDDDGKTSIDFSDWRTVSGHRFAFKSVQSDGDRAFDTTQITRSVAVDVPIDATTFAPLVGRHIEMTGSQTLPLTFREGHLYVSARIDDRPYTFLVDTGAQNIVLDKRVADQLKLSGVGDLEASGAKRTGGLQLVTLDQLQIGRGKLSNLVATTIDLHGSTDGAFAIDGILGYPFFASAVVKIDTANRSMTFGPPGSFALAGDKLAVDVDRAIPEVRLRVNGLTDAPFIIDTGNAAELLLYKPFVDRHAGIVPFSTTTRNSYGVGGMAASYRSTVEEIDIGTITIYHAEADVMQATRGAFADRFDAGNVGLGVLANFVLTFDLANDALYVERAASFDDGRSRN